MLSPDGQHKVRLQTDNEQDWKNQKSGFVLFLVGHLYLENDTVQPWLTLLLSDGRCFHMVVDFSVTGQLLIQIQTQG